MIDLLSPFRRFSCLGLAAAVAAGVLASASVANAQASVAVLYSFTSGAADGALPFAGVIQGSDGTLFGTTVGGGPINGGTIFRMAPDGGGYTVLHSFNGGGTDGVYPYGGLIQGSDGTLYGTTFFGGASNRGTIFQMAPDGSSFTVLHSFTCATDGCDPYASLIQTSDGTLYGTTFHGGPIDAGTIFNMAADGSGYTILHSFIGDGVDGAYPYAGLIQGSDGTLYGTTTAAPTTPARFSTWPPNRQTDRLTIAESLSLVPRRPAEWAKDEGDRSHGS